MKQHGISDAEWVVMKVLWQQAPMSATEVFDAIGPSMEWHPKTVRTLLGRLVKKGVLHREKRAGALRFSPKVPEEECVREASRSFLDRCFGGAMQPMLAHFLENEEVDDATIEALRAMLDKAEERRGSR